jgi:uncharacterized protein YgbK (DUF1537 family)
MVQDHRREDEGDARRFLSKNMKLSEMLATQPPPNPVPGARRLIREALLQSGKRLVVIDDDPTGMQTVQDVSVFMDWSVDTLRRALSMPAPVFFVSVNTRSLNPPEARALALEVGRNLRQAVDRENARVLLASRSDSTLRGHFPYEVDALCQGFELNPDGLIFAPAFIEAGRFTIGDTHWAEMKGALIPVSETEFARDPMFPFRNSNLKSWIEEKTAGAVPAEKVISISLDLLRRGRPADVALELLKSREGVPVILNAAEYADLDVVSLAIESAEDAGKTFVYRCSASFLKSRGGFEDRALLTRPEMVGEAGPGLIIAGSYVEKSSSQIKRLLDSGLASGIELNVDRVVSDTHREDEVRRVAAGVSEQLGRGRSVALFTTRQVRIAPGEDFAGTGKKIMQALCEVTGQVSVRPAYVVAKGGITSIQIARVALGANQTLALGQILPGVPVWRLGGESRWPGISYVVFPGNVGDEDALLNAIKTLAG